MDDSTVDTTVRLPQLHRRFRTSSDFERQEYQLLPFSFMRLDRTDASDNAACVLTSISGEHLLVAAKDVRSLITRDNRIHPALFSELAGKQFVRTGQHSVSVELLAQAVRSKHSALNEGTSLHILVATLRCDHACPYCQVSRVSDDARRFDMSTADADAALDLVFASPSPSLKVEIQGGEPLLNFPLVQHIVKSATARARHDGRNVQCVIATNLSQVTEDMCLFFRDFDVQISTSIDGPHDLHNANRPRPGNDAFERTVEGIALVREICGRSSVSALPTTTRRSLGRVTEIIDTYLGLGLDGIFLRALSPFGFAVKTQKSIGYETQAFIDHFIQGVQYCIDLCHRGYDFREYYSSLLLRRMLTPFDTGYVDLMSPMGAGFVVMVYNYDGWVYPSDEARMLAETGDTSFRLGPIQGSTRQTLLGTPHFRQLMIETMTDAVPGCDYCAYRPWCGTDPVYHKATQRDSIGVRSVSAFCKRNMSVFDWLVAKLAAGGPDAAVLRRWGELG